MTAAHTIVTQACLGVLLHLDEIVTKDSLEKFPLAKYATKHLVVMHGLKMGRRRCKTE